MIPRDGTFLLVAMLGILLLAGCRSAHKVRDCEYGKYLHAASRAYHSSDAVSPAINPIANHLAGPHPVEAYINFALLQNPDVQAARKQVEAAAHRVPQAASLQDPTVSVTALPEQLQTAAGQQELVLSASQKLPWHGKLRTRANLAEQATNVARANLATVELATIEKVKRAYYELYFVQQAIGITESDLKLLVEIRDSAEARYKTGKVTQQDVLRADLEVSNVDNELIRLRQRLESAQARLARLLHVSPQTPLRALMQLSAEQIPGDLDSLHRQAIASRPELHAQLASIMRDRRAVDLARLDYLPDVTVGMTWIDIAPAGISPVANGRDAFLLGASVNLPIYRRRLDSGVREAEARAVSSARQYDSLRDATLEEVMDLFVQARSQQDLLKLFEADILPKARQTLEISTRAYNVGDVDFLQLIDNWRQLLRYEISYRRIEAQLRQTLATLERVVGGRPQVSDELEMLPPPENDLPQPSK